MTEDDLGRIEQALGVTLPKAYRSRMLAFPIPALAGNSEDELWDDAAEIIRLNQELRKGNSVSKPWPPHMLALGRDGSGCQIAIDLRNPEGPVWWVDRTHLDQSGPWEKPFEAWFEEWVVETKEGLEDDGIDPMGSPQAREEGRSRIANAGCRNMIVLIVIVTVILIIIKISFFRK